MTELLFSYGTLRLRDVQLATFGRELAGRDDAIVGFELDHVMITDPHVIATSGSDRHPILRPTDHPGAEVQGIVFAVSDAELAAADDYEVDDYARIGCRCAPVRTPGSTSSPASHQAFSVHVAAVSPSCCATTFPSTAISQCGFGVPL